MINQYSDIYVSDNQILVIIKNMCLKVTYDYTYYNIKQSFNMLSVYKMNRAQLIAELQSFPMEVIGNIHDLRDSVKLGREICKMFKSEEESSNNQKIYKVLVKEFADDEEYKVFGTYQSEEEANEAIDLDCQAECLNCDCSPDDEDYQVMFKDFRDAFKIEVV